MVNITLSIPEEMKEKMEQFPEINWSGLIRKLLLEKINHLVWKEEMLKQLKKEEDFDNWAVEMGRNLKSKRLKELKKKKII